MFKLSKKVAVFIPVADNEGRKIDSETIQEKVNNITAAVGGVTTYEAVGGWISDKQGMMTDDIKIHEWYYSDDTASEIRLYIDSVVRVLTGFYNQEAVSVKVGEDLYILERGDSVDGLL